MTTDKKFIPDGYILLARGLLRSGIMEKPPLYLKLWVWMLINASHTGHGNLKRGQLFTSLEKMCEVMKYMVGASLRRPTKKKIRTACDYLSKGTMIGTTKVTQGMIITINNYDFYQTPSNYEGHAEGHTDGNCRGTIYNKKGNKNENTPATISSLRERYSDQGLIERAFQAISTTRKNGKVADSVLLAQLQKWNLYPAEQVEAGIRIYLEKGYAGQGKRESYLLGIIRNRSSSQADNGSPGAATEPVIEKPKLIDTRDIYDN
jgi:hypothetical protein